MKTKDIISFVVGLMFGLLLMRQCESKPQIITKTKTKIVKVTDTITKVKIDTLYRYVNVEKVKDSIIYRDVATSNTIKAKQYTTEVNSNSANAKLDITTTGELLDVKGYITFPKIETTTETIIRRDNSGFYVFGKMPINNMTNPELGVLLQIKNKMLIFGSAQLNELSKKLDYKIGLGVKVW